jgi:hypothetical protein
MTTGTRLGSPSRNPIALFSHVARRLLHLGQLRNRTTFATWLAVARGAHPLRVFNKAICLSVCRIHKLFVCLCLWRIHIACRIHKLCVCLWRIHSAARLLVWRLLAPDTWHAASPSGMLSRRASSRLARRAAQGSRRIPGCGTRDGAHGTALRILLLSRLLLACGP